MTNRLTNSFMKHTKEMLVAGDLNAKYYAWGFKGKALMEWISENHLFIEIIENEPIFVRHGQEFYYRHNPLDSTFKRHKRLSHHCHQNIYYKLKKLNLIIEGTTTSYKWRVKQELIPQFKGNKTFKITSYKNKWRPVYS